MKIWSLSLLMLLVSVVFVDKVSANDFEDHELDEISATFNMTHDQDDEHSDDDEDGGRPAPGHYGGNAFSFSGPVIDAEIPTNIVLDISIGGFRDATGNDSQDMHFSIEIPFGEWASLQIYTSVENWDIDRETQENWGIEERSGTSWNDVNVTGKFRLFREGKYRPVVSFKLGLKSPSGGDEERRNTDTLGAELSALIAKTILEDKGLIKKVRLMAEVGFTTWDDDFEPGETTGFSQNDAVKYAVAVQIQFGERVTTTIGAYGFYGWREVGDNPLTAYAELAYKISKRVSTYFHGQVGLNEDANDFRASWGFRILF